MELKLIKFIIHVYTANLKQINANSFLLNSFTVNSLLFKKSNLASCVYSGYISKNCSFLTRAYTILLVSHRVLFSLSQITEENSMFDAYMLLKILN